MKQETKVKIRKLIRETINNQRIINETPNNMKKLIIKALDDAMSKLDSLTMKPSTTIKSIDISDVSPLKIVSFMKNNKIPNNAYFCRTKK